VKACILNQILYYYIHTVKEKMNGIKPGMVHFGCLRPYLHQILPLIRCVSDTHKFPLLLSMNLMCYLLVTFSDMSSKFSLVRDCSKDDTSHTYLVCKIVDSFLHLISCAFQTKISYYQREYRTLCFLILAIILWINISFGGGTSFG